MSKKRNNQPRPLSEQIHSKALDERLKFVEGFVRLAVQDLQGIANQLNVLGSVVQATVNVLGPGAVQNEMARLANPEPPPAPPSEEEKATAGEKVIAALEEAVSADQAENRPAEPT